VKAIMLLFDSLKKDWLPSYGGDIIAPNFERLAKHTVAFDNFYVGSLPCMPARRELHTGRYNFFHNGWGPLEPFDDSMPQILRENGIHTHLVSDHHHYWREGGANYHGRYSTYENIRGQEGDRWKGEVGAPLVNTTMADSLPDFFKAMFVQDGVNRKHMATEESHCQTLTFDAGLDFIQTNLNADKWFLQLECFDPHEPFYTFEQYKRMYPTKYEGRHVDWPMPGSCNQAEDYVAYVQNQYKALVSMIDKNLGRLLDMMDENSLWDDTMLIVNTDHGLLLGEHEWWSKGAMPAYNEIANIPFFIWDPRQKKMGERREALAQNIDVPATLLDFFGLPVPPDMQGKPLTPVLTDDTSIHNTILFGYHGGMTNITDGETLYMRAPCTYENTPLFAYTLAPARMGDRMSVKDLKDAVLAPAFKFTKGLQTLKLDASSHGSPFGNMFRFGNRLYNLKTDPKERKPLDNPALELKMINGMVQMMRETDAPEEQYERLGLREGMTEQDILKSREAREKALDAACIEGIECTKEAQSVFLALHSLMHGADIEKPFREFMKAEGIACVTPNDIYTYVIKTLPKAQAGGMLMMLRLAARLN
jgi:Arylsulfatase A and related enzymes